MLHVEVVVWDLHNMIHIPKLDIFFPESKFKSQGISYLFSEINSLYIILCGTNYNKFYFI